MSGETFPAKENLCLYSLCYRLGDLRLYPYSEGDYSQVPNAQKTSLTITGKLYSTRKKTRKSVYEESILDLIL
jgi:hypothetical protein